MSADEIKEAFDLIDQDKSGSLTKDEVREVMKAVFRENYNESLLDEVFNSADVSGDGKISYEEFVKACNSSSC